MKAFTSFKATVIALFAVEAACLDTASKCVCHTKTNPHIKPSLGLIMREDGSVLTLVHSATL